MIKLHIPDQVEENFETFFSFSWKADNHSSANNQVGDEMAHLCDSFGYPLNIRRARHGFEDTWISMLQGHVKIRQELIIAGHQLDQPVGDHARVGVEQAHPRDIRDHWQQISQQVCQRVAFTSIDTVSSHILGDEIDLLHTQGLERKGVADHRVS